MLRLSEVSVVTSSTDLRCHYGLVVPIVLGLDNCLLDGVVDRKPRDWRDAVLFAKSHKDFLKCKLSL